MTKFIAQLTDINKKKAGFTLIELLVVVAIIGLLTSVIMVGFGNARRKSRDAKRLSDMQQIRSGLDLFFTNGGYPAQATWLTGALTCGALASVMQVPKDPLTGAYYNYEVTSPVTGCGGNLYRDYYVQFTTEGSTDIGAAATYYLSPRGITTFQPFIP